MGSEFDNPKGATTKTGSLKKASKPPLKDRELGAALRSTYQTTVDESVPDEMLDLLNKLS